MEIRTEADYQATMRRLKYLLDHVPTNLVEITALRNAANTCENENGHCQPPFKSLITKVEQKIRKHQLAARQMAELLGIIPSRPREVLRSKLSITLDLTKRLHTRLSIPGDFILEAA